MKHLGGHEVSTTRGRSTRRGAGAGLVLTAALLAAAPARAHEIGLSRGDYAAEGPWVRSELVFAQKELISLVAGLDADRDGALSPAEIAVGRAAMQGAIAGRVKVRGDGVVCSAELGEVEITEQDGVLVRVDHRCAAPPREVRVDLALLDDLPDGHRHLVRAFAAEGPLDRVLARRAQSFGWRPPAPPAEPSAIAPAALGARFAARSWTLPALLVGLLGRAPGARGRALFASLFTAALLLGLFVAASNLFVPGPRAVGAAIAVALAYAGVDLFAARPSGAWVALSFGAVHGLAAGLACASSPGGLAPFALGVLAVTAIFAASIGALGGLAEARDLLGGRRRHALGAALVAAALFALSGALRG